MADQAVPLYRFLAPRHWLTWLGLGVLRVMVMLPHRSRMRIGRTLGQLAFRIAGRRRRIAVRNLQICFPELTSQARQELLRRHFESLGMGLIETGVCWWVADDRIRPLLHVEGRDHLEAALARGNGVLMLTGHFNPVDLGGRFLTMLAPVTAIYRPHENPLLNEIMRRGREASAKRAVSKRDVRGLVGALRANHAIWYAPDQNYRGKYGIVVPFFSTPAPTNSATSRIARISGAAVVPFFPERRKDGSGYRLIIRPALDNFPSDDPVADTLRINELLEQRIRETPADYLWIHRRFKAAEAGQPDPYADV